MQFGQLITERITYKVQLFLPVDNPINASSGNSAKYKFTRSDVLSGTFWACLILMNANLS